MDTVAEFLTRVRNAGIARHDKVDVPSSKLRVGIANVLKSAGYIEDFKVVRDGKQGIMRMYLKYSNGGQHAISSVERKSRPGRRFYVQATNVPVVRSGYGLSIISTSKGVMSDKEALKNNLGGELICTVW